MKSLLRLLCLFILGLAMLISPACGGDGGNGGSSASSSSGQATDGSGSDPAPTGTPTSPVIAWNRVLLNTYYLEDPVAVIIDISDIDANLDKVLYSWVLPSGMIQRGILSAPGDFPSAGTIGLWVVKRSMGWADLGTHTVTVWATDKQGNQSNILSHTFKVFTQP